MSLVVIFEDSDLIFTNLKDPEDDWLFDSFETCEVFDHDKMFFSSTGEGSQLNYVDFI